MGVKNLWDILESCKKTLPLHHLENKRVCIDLSCWMVQLHNVNKSHCSLKEKVYLKGLFHRLRALIALNCSLVFVTDGSIPAIKLSTYRRRLNSGNEVAQDESSSQNASSLPRNMGSEFSRMIKEAKTLGTALGIPCLDGIEEAEAQCALLNSESLCDGCFTSDSDVFLFGARTVYREICLGEGGYVVSYEMADIERTLGFGRNTLITLALLLGCDYSHGVHGIGQELACRVVKTVGDDVILKKIASEGLSFVKKAKKSKKKAKGGSDENLPINNIILNGNECDTNGDNKFLQVIDAYLKPRCHSLDSDVVHRALSLYPFERAQLQEICAQFFEWPPEKTDEYILPKIAERNLRRFSNLRATSSDLGVQLPLDEMPVKCPMSRIVKHRKVNGKDCFEVTWDKFDGLESSIIPADLVESACPEKIREFEEKKAEDKKRNHKKSRKKKIESTAPLAELDHKLQDLLLDINRASNSTTTVRKDVRKDVDVIDQNQHLDKVSEFKNNCPNASEDCYTNGPSLKTYESASTSFGSVIIDLLSPPRIAGGRGDCYTSGSSSSQSEIIDLLSPSPPIRERKVSKGHEAFAQKVDIIDLIESDLETSPEHARKAMELRSFIATIRDEIS